jgi:hypothetical protein
MTAVWMGHTSIRQELAANRIEMTGDKAIAQSMQRWLGLSPFAKERSRVPA